MPKRRTVYEVVIEGQRVSVEHEERFILFLRLWDTDAKALVWQVDKVADELDGLRSWFGNMWRGMPHMRVLDRATGEIFEPKLALEKVVHPEDAVVPDPLSV